MCLGFNERPLCLLVDVYNNPKTAIERKRLQKWLPTTQLKNAILLKKYLVIGHHKPLINANKRVENKSGATSIKNYLNRLNAEYGGCS